MSRTTPENYEMAVPAPRRQNAGDIVGDSESGTYRSSTRPAPSQEALSFGEQRSKTGRGPSRQPRSRASSHISSSHRGSGSCESVALPQHYAGPSPTGVLQAPERSEQPDCCRRFLLAVRTAFCPCAHPEEDRTESQAGTGGLDRGGILRSSGADNSTGRKQAEVEAQPTKQVRKEARRREDAILEQKYETVKARAERLHSLLGNLTNPDPEAERHQWFRPAYT